MNSRSRSIRLISERKGRAYRSKLENAREVGRHLERNLAKLANEHPIIGDVRGSRLSWGIDLVSDREGRRPLDRAEAKHSVGAFCREGVSLGLMGSHGNILKMCPPVPFSRDNADEAIDACLRAAPHR